MNTHSIVQSTGLYYTHKLGVTVSGRERALWVGACGLACGVGFGVGRATADHAVADTVGPSVAPSERAVPERPPLRPAPRLEAPATKTAPVEDLELTWDEVEPSLQPEVIRGLLDAMVDEGQGDFEVFALDCEAFPCVAMLDWPSDGYLSDSEARDWVAQGLPTSNVWSRTVGGRRFIMATMGGTESYARQRALSEAAHRAEVALQRATAEILAEEGGGP